MKFTKMHGCGNDYIYINGFDEIIENPKELAIKMSNRNFGVGSDGLVLILPSNNADFRMRMFNSDGSESEMCGNAVRCVGKYVYDKGLIKEDTITIETLAGIKILNLMIEEGNVYSVKVDMGEPILEASLIPVISNKQPVIDEQLEVLNTIYGFTCVSMGNPHAVTFVNDVKKFPLETVGPIVEIAPIFPRKTNVEFAQVVDEENIYMRVWERGAGETLACGTGACATLVACVLNGVTKRRATLHLIGGDLMIEWDENTNHVFMTGPAQTVFEGLWLL
ncbi:MAG: diaminopimelate epimerase [Firmicutes bacterium HGW-Firmicutes-1]|nr:MAG: diaminopimelate epimerase [Firmicutes bacterium HGW-Firmicutes-1]